MKCDFEVGDIVRLPSDGNNEMTVIEKDNDHVNVAWFDHEYHLQTARFLVAALRPAPPSEG